MLLRALKQIFIDKNGLSQRLMDKGIIRCTNKIILILERELFLFVLCCFVKHIGYFSDINTIQYF